MSDFAEGGAPRGAPRGPSGPSEKQLSFIKTLQQRLKLTDEQLDAVVKEVVEIDRLADLGRMEASELIDELVRRADAAGVNAPPGGGTATEKQVKFMKSLKRRAKLDDAGFAAVLKEVANVETPEQVGKKEASAVIDKLLSMAGETPKPAPTRGGASGGRPGPGRAPARGPVRAPAPGPGRAPAPPPEGGSALDERPPDRPDEGPPPEGDDDLPF